MIKRPWTTTEVRELAELRTWDAATIGAAMGRSPGAVREMARRQGIQRPAFGYTAEQRQRAAELRAQRLPIREIARRLGASHGAVHNWTKEAA